MRYKQRPNVLTFIGSSALSLSPSFFHSFSPSFTPSHLYSLPPIFLHSLPPTFFYSLSPSLPLLPPFLLPSFTLSLSLYPSPCDRIPSQERLGQGRKGQGPRAGDRAGQTVKKFLTGSRLSTPASERLWRRKETSRPEVFGPKGIL